MSPFNSALCAYIPTYQTGDATPWLSTGELSIFPFYGSLPSSLFLFINSVHLNSHFHLPLQLDKHLRNPIRFRAKRQPRAPALRITHAQPLARRPRICNHRPKPTGSSQRHASIPLDIGTPIDTREVRACAIRPAAVGLASRGGVYHTKAQE